MKTNRLTTAIFLVTFLSLCFSCSDDAEVQPPKGNENASTISDLIEDDDDIRLPDDTTSFRSANSIPASEIDISQYAIHIKDNYGDWIYLNELERGNTPRYYRGYAGVFISKGTAFKASANYNINNKELSAVLAYKYDIVLLYQCSWKTINYFEGAFCLMMEYSTRQYPNKLRMVKLLIKEGSFPEMNVY